MTASSVSLQRGLEMLRDGQFDDSLDFLLQALVESPTNTEVHVFLAYAYSKLGDQEKAIEILEQALAISPQSAKIHYNLGVVYQKSRNLTQAKDQYARALTLDPNYEAAKKALASIPGATTA
jgi:Tfp pilus assembly protein PilF